MTFEDELQGRQWADDNPYVLLVVRPDSSHQVIDVAERGWHQTYADWMRGRMQWYLVRKDSGNVVFGIEVFDGEQPYYSTHVVGNTTAAFLTIKAFGIGKKRLDGSVQRLWITEYGLVCAGDDVDSFLDEIMRQRLATLREQARREQEMSAQVRSEP